MILVKRHSFTSLSPSPSPLFYSGYASDVTEIMKYLPKICQGFLMSATLSPELNSLKKVVLHSPAVLKLEEADHGYGLDGDGNDGEDEVGGKKKKLNLTQLYLTLAKNDKNLVLYVFLKVRSCIYTNTSNNHILY